MTFKVIVSALVLTLAAAAQITTGGAAPPVPPPVVITSPPPASTAPAGLPNWVGVEAMYNFGSSPKVTGGFTEASLISSAIQAYSFSTYDVSVVKVNGTWTYQSVPRTGFAMLLKTYGPFNIIGFGNFGVATDGANASFAMAGGGVVVVKLGKNSPWTLFGGYHILNTGAQGGSRTVPEFGIGRTF